MADGELIQPLDQFDGTMKVKDWASLPRLPAPPAAEEESHWVFPEKLNSPNETKYFHQDLDSNGKRLNSGNRYTVTFAKGQTPPVHGFWSLSIYNEHHFFVANTINRFSVGTKNKDLKFAKDGSLTIYGQPDPPSDRTQRANWLPAPKGDFSLYVRAYWPKESVTDGSWTPPAVVRIE